MGGKVSVKLKGINRWSDGQGKPFDRGNVREVDADRAEHLLGTGHFEPVVVAAGPSDDVKGRVAALINALAAA